MYKIPPSCANQVLADYLHGRLHIEAPLAFSALKLFLQSIWYGQGSSSEIHCCECNIRGVMQWSGRECGNTFFFITNLTYPSIHSFIPFITFFHTLQYILLYPSIHSFIPFNTFCYTLQYILPYPSIQSSIPFNTFCYIFHSYGFVFVMISFYHFFIKLLHLLN